VEEGIVIPATLAGVTAPLAFVDSFEVAAMLICDLVDLHLESSFFSRMISNINSSSVSIRRSTS
jgi:hypothetical protein